MASAREKLTWAPCWTTDDGWPAPKWHESWTPVLSDGALRSHCGESALVRGLACAASGAVEVLLQGDPPRGLDVRVLGKRTLAARVWIRGDALAGACNCPQGKAGRFCMHQVAAAVVWRQRLSGVEPQIDRQSRKIVLTREKHETQVIQRHERLRGFLRSLDRTILAKKLRDSPAQALPETLVGLDADALTDKLLEAARTYGLWHELYRWCEQDPGKRSTGGNLQDPVLVASALTRLNSR